MNEMEEIYSGKSLDSIPWNIETPPKILVELCDNGKIEPCKTVDMGCGTGNYAIYLARLGFNVTGLDISPSAVRFAKENARKNGLKCSFRALDVLGNLEEFKHSFDFAYDWEMLHHIYPENRKKYVGNVHGILTDNGKYLSVCFSEKDRHFGGSGKYRKTPLGTVLYFSSENELQQLFEPYFKIIELRTMEISGKTAPHWVVYVFMEKK